VTGTDRNRVSAGVRTGGQFAHEQRRESDAHLDAEPRIARPRELVEVVDPDDPHGMPAFDGLVEDAPRSLEPGFYEATTDYGERVTLHVPATETGQIEWRHGYDEQRSWSAATVRGIDVTVYQDLGGVETDPFDVDREGTSIGQVYFDHDEGGWRSFVAHAGPQAYRDRLPTRDDAIDWIVANQPDAS